MRPDIEYLEQRRLELQKSLDEPKSREERNRLGQFATPSLLALDMLRYGESLLPKNTPLCFLDPAIGTGSFYSALLRTMPEERISASLGFEVDPHYAVPAQELWKDTSLSLEIADFTAIYPKPEFNLVICNPPYVRHHHINSLEKRLLKERVEHFCGMKLSGLAGLYCYFIALSLAWMMEGGIAGWLVPSEFMEVNYGRELKRYLLEKTTLLHIHRFAPEDVQFSDALVSSAIVWFRKSIPPKEHEVMFTFGGTLFKPSSSRSIPTRSLGEETKWTKFPAFDRPTRHVKIKLSDFFKIQRGVATGENKFFILSEKDIADRNLPLEFFSPILPSPRYLSSDEVHSLSDGTPDIDHRLFLLDTRSSEEDILIAYPSLHSYIQEGKNRGLHERYLCSRRTPWYSQERRPAAPIVCTYLGRNNGDARRPFRFILNHSRATVANVYLALYPTQRFASILTKDASLLRRVWEELNRIPPEALLGEGRVYGGGLHKLEPKELGNLDADFITSMLPNTLCSLSEGLQLDLFSDGRELPA